METVKVFFFTGLHRALWKPPPTFSHECMSTQRSLCQSAILEMQNPGIYSSLVVLISIILSMCLLLAFWKFILWLNQPTVELAVCYASFIRGSKYWARRVIHRPAHSHMRIAYLLTLHMVVVAHLAGDLLPWLQAGTDFFGCCCLLFVACSTSCMVIWLCWCVCIYTLICFADCSFLSAPIPLSHSFPSAFLLHHVV